ncbi:MAG TPA: cell division protein ZapA [Sphingobacteriaceae bacterium]|nr:cell division protein ZapA [Sphingobacteriaceae bacterium]
MTVAGDRSDQGIRVEVRILGDTYAIRSHHASAEEVQRVADRVDIRMQELRRRYPNVSIYRLAILTALNLADELTRLQAQHEQLTASLQERIRELEQQLRERQPD